MNRLYVLILTVLIQSSAAAAEPMSPQLYEIITETAMPHLEENLRYATTREHRCLEQSGLLSAFSVLQSAALKDCRLDPETRQQDVVSYALVCEGGHGTTGHATWQLGPTRSTGTLNVKLGGKNMTFSQRVTARVLGACRNGTALVSPSFPAHGLQSMGNGDSMLRWPLRELCCTCVLAVSCLGLPAHAELPPLRPIQTISPLPSDIVALPGVEPRGAFGHATAMSGDIALISMPETLIDSRGSVMTYHRGLDGVWTRTSKLNGVLGEFRFGYAMAFRDNIAAIASSGAVYLFKHQSTTPEWKLLRRVAPGSGGAQSVDYQDGRLVIGAFGTASVYEIDRATGNVLRQSTLRAADYDPEAAFGFSLGLANDTIVVGATDPGGPERPAGTGAAYVFKLIDGQWRQRQKLIPPDGAESDGFGFSVAIDKAMIIVGSPGHQNVGAAYDPPTDIPVAGGAAYVYTPEAGLWKLRSKLRPTPLQDPFYRAFGLQIAMFDTRVAVTAVRPLPVTTLDDRYLGLVFAYERSG